MLLGRFVGWIMVLSGLGLLARYYFDSERAGQIVPNAWYDVWHGADAAMLNFMERSVADRITATMVSGWTAALLLLFGILLIWGCRRRMD